MPDRKPLWGKDENGDPVLKGFGPGRGRPKTHRQSLLSKAIREPEEPDPLSSAPAPEGQVINDAWSQAARDITNFLTGKDDDFGEMVSNILRCKGYDPQQIARNRTTYGPILQTVRDELNAKRQKHFEDNAEFGGTGSVGAETLFRSNQGRFLRDMDE